MNSSLLRAGARGFCLLSLVLGGCGACWLLVRGPLVDLLEALATGPTAGPGGLGSLSFSQALSGLCAGVVVGGSAWLAATTSLAVVLAVAQVGARTDHALNGPQHPLLSATLGAAQVCASRFCPELTRRLLLVACGVALGSGPGTSAAATAAAPEHRGVGPHRVVVQDQIAGLGLPDRQVGARNRSPTTPAIATVSHGDSLWSISLHRLPPGATNAVITAAWHELYRVNPGRIGPDPDRILPGTILRLPWPENQRKDH